MGLYSMQPSQMGDHELGEENGGPAKVWTGTAQPD